LFLTIRALGTEFIAAASAVRGTGRV
jgi:hypothetical protein